MKTFSKIVAVVATTFILGGCAGSGMSQNTQQGAIMGGIAGAVIGSATGDGSNQRMIRGAIIGSAVGGMIGNAQDNQYR